jgi:hypothetical protein
MTTQKHQREQLREVKRGRGRPAKPRDDDGVFKAYDDVIEDAGGEYRQANEARAYLDDEWGGS